MIDLISSEASRDKRDAGWGNGSCQVITRNHKSNQREQIFLFNPDRKTIPWRIREPEVSFLFKLSRGRILGWPWSFLGGGMDTWPKEGFIKMIASGALEVAPGVQSFGGLLWINSPMLFPSQDGLESGRAGPQREDHRLLENTTSF